jgi:uncharacterized coiled-coil protein SlyX
MNAHARRVHRILAVQQHLHRIEEWKLSDLQRKLEELQTLQESLIRALNEDHALQGLFIDCMARRLRVLADEAALVGRQRQVQTVQLLEQAARKACAERLAGAADREMERAAAKKELLDVIEQAVGSAAQASRKLGEE